jgi:hypothetical protein
MMKTDLTATELKRELASKGMNYYLGENTENMQWKWWMMCLTDNRYNRNEVLYIECHLDCHSVMKLTQR